MLLFSSSATFIQNRPDPKLFKASIARDQNELSFFLSIELCIKEDFGAPSGACAFGGRIYTQERKKDTESINFDHHLRCCEWLNFEFSKREKHSGWAIRTIYKKLSRGMLKHIHLNQ